MDVAFVQASANVAEEKFAKNERLGFLVSEEEDYGVQSISVVKLK
jgi:hypothetical protein